jgi:photosystem II stability/assembly factor-like uncharacterized protein
MRPNLLLLPFIAFACINEINSQWTIKHFDESTFINDNVIKFKNDSTGLFMGGNSGILKSADAGETWKEIRIETQINVKDFQFEEGSTIYAVGDHYVDAGQDLVSKIIRSADDGETWDSIYSFDKKQLKSIWFFNNDSGIIAGFDGIYRTRDAVNSWDTVWSTGQSGYTYGTVEDISFPVPQTGYAIGEGRTENNPSRLFDHFLLKTYNSGLTWDTIKTFPGLLTTVLFINRDTGFIGTESNPATILKTTDGGNTWNEIPVAAGYSGSVNSIHFISDMTGYATGAPPGFITGGSTSFFISKTIDGGDSWETYDTTGIPLNSIFFMNDTTGFVSGLYDLIMKSNGSIYGLPADYPWHLAVNVKKSEMSDFQSRIYPNPTDGKIRIQQSNRHEPVKTIKLFSVAGLLIRVTEPMADDDPLQFDLSDQPHGLYLIQLTYPGRNEMLKVLKK